MDIVVMILTAENLILDQVPGYLGWKDKNLKYIGANKNLLNSMGRKSLEDLIGLDDSELALNSHQVNILFRQQDLLALQGHSLEIIHGLENEQDKTYFLQKTPLRNHNSEIVGVIYHCTPWSQANFLTSIKKIDKKYQPLESVSDYYTFGIFHNVSNLSDRELECLFFQLRGKTAREIADIFKLSKRTIESYIDNVKFKLGCLNKTEMLVTAIAQGYHHHIPKTLLKFNLPELLK